MERAKGERRRAKGEMLRAKCQGRSVKGEGLIGEYGLMSGGGRGDGSRSVFRWRFCRRSFSSRVSYPLNGGPPFLLARWIHLASATSMTRFYMGHWIDSTIGAACGGGHFRTNLNLPPAEVICFLCCRGDLLPMYPSSTPATLSVEPWTLNLEPNRRDPF